ncbi:MAG: DUF1549 domain-containing protein [Planctomycetota bacterium]|nr:MAG: DUF1549 domain-containing protein [Planctomycetota bacterium]
MFDPPRRAACSCFLRLGLCSVVLAASAASVLPADEKAEKPQVDPQHVEKTNQGLALFKQEVRSLLVNECLRCHGGDDTEGEFDLSTRETLLKGGSSGPAVVAGDASRSRLMRLIRHEDEPYMPMDSGKLSDDEIDLIARWIDNLAPYDKPLLEGDRDDEDWTTREVADESRDFWSLQPLARPSAPAVETAGWCSSPIDQFTLSRLETAGIAPNPQASRRTLIRRASLDLTGLPPTHGEVEAFVNDPAPDAWERLIDRLLASPEYGERWGRHWLDLARFAESHGFEHDYDRPSAFHYRDFVIQALNQNMPYDQFVRFQLAGDELAPQNRLALMATGFLAAGVHSTQITINEAERHRYDEMDDMLNTACTAFLGLTVGCARCHDHKFDPIPMADYYRMLTTFTTTIRSEIELNFDPAGFEAAREKYESEHAPLLEARRDYEQGPLQKKFEEWLAADPTVDELPRWVILDLTSIKSHGGATLEKQPDGSVLASGESPLHETYSFSAVVDLPSIAAVRLEAMADNSLTRSGPGRASNGNFALSDFTITAKPVGTEESPAELDLSTAITTFEQVGLPVKAAIDDDPLSAWAVDPEFGKTQAAVFGLSEPLILNGPTELTFTLRFANNVHHSIGRPRLSVTTSADELSLEGASILQTVVASLNAPADRRTDEQRTALLNWFRTQDEQWQSLDRAIREHAAQAPQPPLQKVLIASEGLPPVKLHTQSPREFFDETFFLKRGDVNQKIRPAKPGFLQAVSLDVEDEAGRSATVPDRSAQDSAESVWSPPEDWQPSGRRSDLALWMTDVERGAGRLLARVIVNRLWQHHFGQGIVATPSDFGRQGERPTHPELLDWLAWELIENEWDLKAMHRAMMTSSTYQLDARADSEKLAVDPENKLLWRFTRRRLEAEVVRDSLLAASGRLDQTMYGPGTLDTSMTRRSIYFTVKRSQLIPMMVVFDAPDALGGIGDRPATTVAPQALYLMNNEQVRACSEAMAAEIVPPDPNTPFVAEEQAAAAFRSALARNPDAQEQAAAEAFLAKQAAIHQAAGLGDANLRAVTDLCQVLMSLNEFAYLD